MSLCLCKELKTLKVEADMGADPLWCNECHANLEIDEFPLSEALKDELLEWVDAYGTGIDWETDGIVTGGVAMEQQHNERGAELTEKVKLALAPVFEGCYEVLTVTQLEEPLVRPKKGDGHILLNENTLNDVELYYMDYFPAQTVGDLIFNYWD